MGQEAQKRAHADERVRDTAALEPRQPERADSGRMPLTGLAERAAVTAPDDVRAKTMTPDAVLNLQKRAGNQAVVSLMRPLAVRRASLLIQRRAKAKRPKAGGGVRRAPTAQRAPAAGAAPTTAEAAGPESTKDDPDTSEFTDVPGEAAAKMASMPKAARRVPPPPPLPGKAAAKPPVFKKGTAKKVAFPAKKAPAAKKASGKPVKSVIGEIVKKPTPKLPPPYKRGDDVPPPPGPATPMTPKDDPAFAKVAMAAKKTIKAAKRHPKGKDEGDAALASAKSPGNEKQATAEVVRAGELEKDAKPGKFDEEAFIAAVMVEIEKTKPKNLDEADEVDGKAEKVKGAIGKEVGEHKEEAAGKVEEEAPKKAELSKGEDRKETPDKPLEIEEPGGLKASGAMPAPVPNERVDFRSGPAEVDKEMAEAEITDEQLAESNEPEFEGALKAKKDGEEAAQKAPGDIRKAEGDVLKKAGSQAAAAEKSAVAGAKATIGEKKAGIGADKKTTVSKDEAERKKVSDEINKMFGDTQKDVGEILKGLDKTVDDLFTKGEKAIREAFTYDWETRLENYKDDRYSGLRGKARWIRDKFKGLPAKAKELFKKSQDMYESMMKKLVKRIAGIVSAELTKATNRIKEGRDAVTKYVAGLKGEQAKFGAEAAKDIGDKFDQLDSDVQDKFDEMAKDIAKKYSESRDAVDSEINEAWDKEKGLIDKAIDAVKGVYKAIKNLKDMLVRVFKKIVDVIGSIVAHPIRFLENFFSAVKAGISRFMDNIVDHLKKGIMGWLTGNLGAKGIEIPDTFDLPSMGKLVLSVFGLSWGFMRDRLVGKITEPGMAAIEKGASIIEKIKGGPAALWEMVVEKFTDFEDLVLGKIKDFLTNKIVIAGITFLISMLNPASAFIKACKMIYDVVMFILDKGKQIGEFIEAIVDAAGDIARGGGGGVPEKIEGVLAKALPLAIGFCASLLGLGGIGKKIQEIIDKVRKPIFKVIDKIIDGVVKVTRPIWKAGIKLFNKGKGLYDKGKAKAKAAYAKGKEKVKAGYEKGKAKVKGGIDKAKAKVKSLFKPQKKGVSMAGASHTLTAAPRSDGKVVITMASAEGLLSNKIGEAITSLKENAAATTDAKQRDLIEAQIKQLKEIAVIAVELERKAAASGKDQVLASGAPPGFAEAMVALANKIEAYGNKNKVADITKATLESVAVDMRMLAKFGLPMASYLQAQKVADTLNAAIDIRPTNMTAETLYESGANPKSEAFKEKTLNEDDVLLGAPREHIGKVAWFNPSRPNKVATDQLMKEEGGPAWVERWWKRYKQRKDEYEEYAAKIKKKLKEGEILLHSQMGGGGSKGGVILDGVKGLPYTGDHDIYEVHGDATAVINALKAAPFRVQHGAHVDWPKLPAVVEKGGLDAAETEIFNTIIRTHAPSGKALLRINPKGPPTAVSSATPRAAKATTKGAGSAPGPEIDGAVVQAGPGGIAGLKAAEDKLKAEQAAAVGGAPPVAEKFDIEGEDHTLTSTKDGTDLIVASKNPTELSKHADSAVRTAYNAYRAAVDIAPTHPKKKTASDKHLPAIFTALKAYFTTVVKKVPRASAPGIGNIAPHGQQPLRHDKAGVPVWILESEHVLPRAVSDAAFDAMGQAGIPAGGKDYEAQHTIMIYKGAADIKTDKAASGDQGRIKDMKSYAAEIKTEIAKTKASQRHQLEDQVEKTIRAILDASANDAVKRTSKAVKEENQLNGDDRGKPGTPEKPVPADGSVITAVNKQIDDIERQLKDRRGY